MDPKLNTNLFDHLCTLLKRLDPEIIQPLISHAGKTIHLEIIDLLSLTIKIQSDRLVNYADDSVPSQYHTILSGRLSDFMLASSPITPLSSRWIYPKRRFRLRERFR